MKLPCPQEAAVSQRSDVCWYSVLPARQAYLRFTAQSFHWVSLCGHSWLSSATLTVIQSAVLFPSPESGMISRGLKPQPSNSVACFSDMTSTPHPESSITNTNHVSINYGGMHHESFHHHKLSGVILGVLSLDNEDNLITQEIPNV